MLIFNGTNHLLFLLLLPIAFDIGGKTAGLALSLSLFIYYSILGLARVLWWKNQGLGWIFLQLLTISQPFLFPYFLIHSFQITYTLIGEKQIPTILNYYEAFLTYLAPLFAIIEGASTAIVIIIFRHKVQQYLEQDEGIQIFISVISLINYVASSYVLYSIYTISGMDIYNATLIGSFMTLTLVITISLALNKIDDTNLWPDLSLLHLMDFVGKIRSITAIQKALSLKFFMAIVYRSGVILSAFYFLKMQNEENDEWGGLVEENLSQRILNFIMSLTTPGIIAVYTHLLLCHYDYLDTGTGMWRWASIAVCWILYMRHLYVENE
ncbi:1145_t:CDS:2 [Funneliformis mosseae]|uniref:1145_t:CDS:1 n=1 Tax=Funneliformis mosseae TaxID=27381 RepID=A0A9N9ELW8_FUNMO|nr:1145_t:CDS:2 [Funneliformis mosseae]